MMPCQDQAYHLLSSFLHMSCIKLASPRIQPPSAQISVSDQWIHTNLSYNYNAEANLLSHLLSNRPNTLSKVQTKAMDHGPLDLKREFSCKLNFL